MCLLWMVEKTATCRLDLMEEGNGKQRRDYGILHFFSDLLIELFIQYDSKLSFMSRVLESRDHASKERLPPQANSDKDLTDDQTIDALTKLTAESLAEDSDC